MAWKVQFTGRAAKQANALPRNLQVKLKLLIGEMQLLGPVRGNWSNYSKLGQDEHHCHLNYRYVAVWCVLDNKIQIIEVTYVGSRKKAPY